MCGQIEKDNSFQIEHHRQNTIYTTGSAQCKYPVSMYNVQPNSLKQQNLRLRSTSKRLWTCANANLMTTLCWLVAPVSFSICSCTGTGQFTCSRKCFSARQNTDHIKCFKVGVKLLYYLSCSPSGCEEPCFKGIPLNSGMQSACDIPSEWRGSEPYELQSEAEQSAATKWFSWLYCMPACI